MWSNMEKKLFFKTAQITVFPNSENENKKEESKIL